MIMLMRIMIVMMMMMMIMMGIILSKNGVNFQSICHRGHSPGSDVSDHFFWSEYLVNWTRFHSLRSESALYWSLNRVIPSDP